MVTTCAMFAGCESPVTDIPVNASGRIPDIVDVNALSNHYIEVIFASPASASTILPSRFVVTGADGNELNVSSADIIGDGTRVLLTTAAQSNVDYTLRVTSSNTAGKIRRDNWQGFDDDVQIFTFEGSLLQGPKLNNAIALSNTQVLLVFDHPLDPATIGAGVFVLTSAGTTDSPTVEEAVLQDPPSSTMVVLTTTAHENREYTIQVDPPAAVTNLDAWPLDPAHTSKTYTGIPLLDETPPELVSAVTISDTNVILSFSEPVLPMDDDKTILDLITIEPPLDVLEAEANPFNTQILLKTAPQRLGTVYVVTASGLIDGAGIALSETAASAVFEPLGDIADPLGIEPRMMGAVSTSNTTIEVSYSVPMGGSAIDPAKYFVVSGNVNAEAAALSIVDAKWVSVSGEDDRTRVELTTRSQATIEYFMAAVGVFDPVGRPVGPQQIFEGWLVLGAHNATFWGNGPIGAPVDEDGDTLPDAEEQVGWQVRVILADGFETLVTRDVTSDPDLADTDEDGLDDAEEKRWGTDPRDPDTDDDLVHDYEEVRVFFSSPTKQDTDKDGMDDHREVAVVKTSPILTDTDGDGFGDAREVFEMNRNPRIADIPFPVLNLSSVRLQINEKYSFTDSQGLSRSETSTSSTTLEQSQTRSFSQSNTETGESFLEAGSEFEFGFEGGGTSEGFKTSDTQGRGVIALAKPFFKGGRKWGTSSQVSAQTALSSRRTYAASLAKGETFTNASNVTRTVDNASVEANLSIDNGGDIAFSISNLELSVLQPGRLQGQFLPVATLTPRSALPAGDDPTFTILPFEEGRGPIVFSDREVFPNLVEDLMRDPRGLITRVANYDITDEFGRNLAFTTQSVVERTVKITVDPGDGTNTVYQVAVNGSLDDGLIMGKTCGELTDSPGDSCDVDSDCCEDSGECPAESCGAQLIGGFDANGKPRPIPLDYVLQDVLGLQKNVDADDAIIAGLDGTVTTIADGDDNQLVPVGTTGVPDRTIVVDAGQNGILETTPNNVEPEENNCFVDNDDRHGCNNLLIQNCVTETMPECRFSWTTDCVTLADDGCGEATFPPDVFDDAYAKTIGYETRRTCSADTVPSITEPLAGGDGIVSTRLEGDDVYARECGEGGRQLCGQGEFVLAGRVIVSPGPNGVIDSVLNGDDIFRGPGEFCRQDGDCDGGTCSASEGLVRLGNSASGDPNRFWVVISSEEIPLGADFGNIMLRPSEGITLAFGQDIDRDGLFARTEYLYGSSDRLKDTDRDRLGDFAEIRVGWDVRVPGQDTVSVYPDPRLRDSDGDGVDDFAELACRTDPRLRDTDGDGLDDGTELACGICCVANDLPAPGMISTGRGQRAKEVVGVGTAFTNLNVGDYIKPIKAGEQYQRIVRILNDTELEIAQPFRLRRGQTCLGCDIGEGVQFLVRSCSPERNYCTDNEDCAVLGRCVDADGNLPPGEVALCRHNDECDSEEEHTCKLNDFPMCMDSCAEICPSDGFYQANSPPDRLDPRNPDTDGDSLADGFEWLDETPGPMNLDPLDAGDAGDFLDSDLDGLPDVEELAGWFVETTACNNRCDHAFDGQCQGDGSFCYSERFGHFAPCEDDEDCDPPGPACDERIWGGVRHTTYLELFDGTFQCSGDTDCGLGEACVRIAAGATLNVCGEGSADYIFGKICMEDSECFGGSCDERNQCACDGCEPRECAVQDDCLGTCADVMPSGSVCLIPSESTFCKETANRNCVPTERARGRCDSNAQNADSFCTADFDCENFPRGECRSCELGADCFDCGPRQVESQQVFSNPLNGDSDFDGLPDLLERNENLNPAAPDTDGDGILDYDEFSDFGTYRSLSIELDGFFLSESESLKIGTSPVSQDTDGDRLSDDFEYFGSWRVLPFGETAVREVRSSPFFPDTDLDGLSDAREYIGVDGVPPNTPLLDSSDSTDPTNADTDSDGFIDGDEVINGTDPTRPAAAKLVRIQYTSIEILNVPLNEDTDEDFEGGQPDLCAEDGYDCECCSCLSGSFGELLWELEVVKPDASRQSLSTEEDCPNLRACDGSCLVDANDFNTIDFGGTPATSIIPRLEPGQTVSLEVQAFELENCPSCDESNSCGGLDDECDRFTFTQLQSCNMSEILELTFDEIPDSGTVTRTIEMFDAECNVRIRARIEGELLDD